MVRKLEKEGVHASVLRIFLVAALLLSSFTNCCYASRKKSSSRILKHVYLIFCLSLLLAVLRTADHRCE